MFFFLKLSSAAAASSAALASCFTVSFSRSSSSFTASNHLFWAPTSKRVVNGISSDEWRRLFRKDPLTGGSSPGEGKESIELWRFFFLKDPLSTVRLPPANGDMSKAMMSASLRHSRTLRPSSILGFGVGPEKGFVICSAFLSSQPA